MIRVRFMHEIEEEILCGVIRFASSIYYRQCNATRMCGFYSHSQCMHIFLHHYDLSLCDNE